MLYIIYISFSNNIDDFEYYFNTNMIYNNNINKEYFLLDVDLDGSGKDSKINETGEKTSRDTMEERKVNNEKLIPYIKQYIINPYIVNTKLKETNKKGEHYVIRRYTWDKQLYDTSRTPWFIDRIKKREKLLKKSPTWFNDEVTILRIKLKFYYSDSSSSWKDIFRLDCDYHRNEYKRKKEILERQKEQQKREKEILEQQKTRN